MMLRAEIFTEHKTHIGLTRPGELLINFNLANSRDICHVPGISADFAFYQNRCPGNCTNTGSLEFDHIRGPEFHGDYRYLAVYQTLKVLIIVV